MAVFVLDSEVVCLRLNLLHIALKLVLLLNIGCKDIEILLEGVDLFVELSGDFVFFGFVEDVLLKLLINLFDFLNQGIRVLFDGLNFFENVLNLTLLHLRILNDIINARKILVTVDIFGHLLPLALKVHDHIFFVLKVFDSLLYVLFEVLDFLDLVLVFDTLVCDALLFVLELVGDWLLIFVPFLLELIELRLDSVDLSLEDFEILSLELLDFLDDFLALFDDLFLGFKRISHLFSFFFDDLLLLGVSLVGGGGLLDLLLEGIELVDIAGNFFLLFFLEDPDVEGGVEGGLLGLGWGRL